MPELPPQLLNSLEKEPNFNRQAFIAAHETGSRTTSLRLNPFKTSALPFPEARPVPWCTGGFYLADRPSFTLDPSLHAGCYYVQEPGSMFLDHAVRTGIGDISDFTVLDLCASPGGKSTLINSLLSNEGILVSNEIVKNRVPALVDNLSRWGTPNSVVTNNDSSAFHRLEELFDLLVVDAPCSGSGLFRKQPGAIEEWSEKNVRMCSERQKQILLNALPAVKSGGYLFYSTCSYSVEENEEIVQWLIRSEGLEFVEIPVVAGWGITVTPHGYRFYPDKTESEGFFCALLRKPGLRSHDGLRSPSLKTATGAEAAAFGRFINVPGLKLWNMNGRLHFFTENMARFLSHVQGGLYLRKAGIYAGEIKGKDLIPSQEMAWSADLGTEVPRIDADESAALSYLRKATFYADPALRGLFLISWKGHGLGWAKFMQGRVNNYFPSELRVRL